MVAAGTLGPGRHRHGGIRDFVIGVRFLDGTGELVTRRRPGGQERGRLRPAEAPGRQPRPARRASSRSRSRCFPAPPAWGTLRRRGGRARGALAAKARALAARASTSRHSTSSLPGSVSVRLGGPAEGARAAARSRLALELGLRRRSACSAPRTPTLWAAAPGARVGAAGCRRLVAKVALRPRRAAGARPRAGGRRRGSPVQRAAARSAGSPGRRTGRSSELDRAPARTRAPAACVLTGAPRRGRCSARSRGGAFAVRARRALDPDGRVRRHRATECDCACSIDDPDVERCRRPQGEAMAGAIGAACTAASACRPARPT